MTGSNPLWAGLAGSAAAIGAVAWGCAASPGAKTGPLATERASQTLDLLVGAELDLGTPPASLAGVPHTDQALATNAAGTTLVVWVVNYYDSADIYGARVDAGGTVLDLSGIAIAAQPYEAAAPAVASDGSGWLVAWEQARKDQTRGVYATRLAASGEVLDAGGFAVPPSPNTNNRTPSIAFDGTNYLVAWTAPNAIMNPQNQWVNAMYATRVDTSGVVLDANGVFVGASAPGMTFGAPRASLAFDGTNWVVVWSAMPTGKTNFDVFAARYTPALSFASSFLVSGTTSNETRPNVHCTGAACFIAWDAGSIFGTRLSGGTVLDPGGIAIATSSGPLLSAPGVAFDGTNWAVAWHKTDGASDTVQAARISTAGTVLDSPFALGDAAPLLPGSAAGVALGDPIGRTFAAWGAAHGGTDGTFIDDDGTASEASPISWQPQRGSLAEAAASNGDYLVVWQDGRLGGSTIFGARMSPTGELRDPDGIQLSGGHDREYHASVASDGTDWLVVWEDYRNGTDYDIYGTRVTAAGSVALPDEVFIGGGSENQLKPRVSFDGTNYLVAWGDESPHQCSVAARVAPNGNVLDASGIALPFAGPTEPCDVAAAAGGWLVVSSIFEPDTLTTRIDGVRIAGNGSIDGNPFPIAGSSSVNQTNQRVSRGASGWLVVWENNGSGTISGARVDAANQVVDSSPIPIAGLGTCRLPSVAFDGSDWLVAWSDFSDSTWGDPFGVRVSSAGAVVDAAPVDLGPQNPMESDVALAGGAGRWLTLYTRHSGPDDGVHGRFITTGCADPTDSDGDTVADCADACPAEAGSPPSGCPVTGEGGAAGDGVAGSAAGSEAGGQGNVGGSAGHGGAGRGGSTAGIGAEAGQSAGGVATGGRGGSSGKGGSAGANEGGSGEAGTAAEGGAANHGGASGKGGTAGKGGAGAGGSVPPGDEGCGCSVPASEGNQPLALALGLVAVGSLIRRRRGGQNLRMPARQ